MIIHRKLAGCILLAALVLSAQAGIAQENGSEEDADSANEVQTALQELRDTPSYERAEKRRDLVQLDQQAVQPLMQEVSDYKQIQDSNYITNCIIALGELGDTAATDVLLKALESQNKQIVYQAAVTLGDVWEGKQNTGEQIKNVNAQLLGLFYRNYPDMEALGAAIGLVKINGLNFRPQDMAVSDALRANIEQWWKANNRVLPPVNAQPWPLLLQRVIAGQGDTARQTLISRKPLAAIENLTKHLARPEGEISQSQWQDLGGILTQITGVPFPPNGGQGSRQDLIKKWKQNWYLALRQRTDQKHITYAWTKLEEKVRQIKMNPSENLTAQIQTYRDILLTQMRGPDDIPADASDEVVRLLETPLEKKEQIAAAMSELDQSTPDYEKIEKLHRIQDAVGEREGREVAGQFLGDITELARAEQNRDVLTLLSNIMSRISGIPCDLGSEGVDRSQAISEWADLVRQNRPDLYQFIQS